MLVYCHLCPDLLPSLPAYAEHLQAKNGHNVARVDSVNKLVALRAAAAAKVKGEQVDEGVSRGLKKVIHQQESNCSLGTGEEDVKMGDQMVVNNNDTGCGHGDQELEVMKDKPTYVCPMCKKTFRYEGNLNTHMKRTHQKLRKFRCPEVACDATFFRVASQQEHIRSKHRWLVEDQLQHVTCGEVGCGKIFSSKGNLTVHKKSVHLKMLPYKCTDCGKGFFRQPGLEQHRRAQHGASKIECPVPGCGSKFSAECNLATHRKKMHGEHKSIKTEAEVHFEHEEVKVKKEVPRQLSVSVNVQSDSGGDVKLEQQRSIQEEMPQAESGNVDQQST